MHRLNIDQFFLKKLMILEAIKNRESCPHWIDFEIYRVLPDSLKDRYLNHFEGPEFNITIEPGKKNHKYSVSCRANHRDPPGRVKCDCSKFYPKTISEFRKMNPFKNEQIEDEGSKKIDEDKEEES